jgi:hypothetical protein
MNQALYAHMNNKRKMKKKKNTRLNQVQGKMMQKLRDLETQSV